jgi:hypothetical protein
MISDKSDIKQKKKERKKKQYKKKLKRTDFDRNVKKKSPETACLSFSCSAHTICKSWSSRKQNKT